MFRGQDGPNDHRRYTPWRAVASVASRPVESDSGAGRSAGPNNPQSLISLSEQRTFLIAPWHVPDAIDFMQANISKPNTSAMVAGAIGVSVRARKGFSFIPGNDPGRFICGPFGYGLSEMICSSR
ncbi:hypothetical protein AGR6A_pAt30021 [Agrobacterium sp. NCPPB 925]|nr:hypothetical protein AGR6A_pAt30021 [Agrobacterium sp. NCPPB 925]